MTDLSAQRPVRELSPDEIEQMLALHRLYLETEYHEGHRANFSSADLTRRDFSGLNLRGIKMDRALLRAADFTAADLRGANLIGAMLQEARCDRADLSRARLSGANLVSASLENACLVGAEMEFAVMANAALQGTCLQQADMSGVLLDHGALTRADLRETNLRGAQKASKSAALSTPLLAAPGHHATSRIKASAGICQWFSPPWSLRWQVAGLFLRNGFQVGLTARRSS
jgi:hypothetical protein